MPPVDATQLVEQRSVPAWMWVLAALTFVVTLYLAWLSAFSIMLTDQCPSAHVGRDRGARCGRW